MPTYGGGSLKIKTEIGSIFVPEYQMPLRLKFFNASILKTLNGSINVSFNTFCKEWNSKGFVNMQIFANILQLVIRIIFLVEKVIFQMKYPVLHLHYNQ